jgi:hypothetical protein
MTSDELRARILHAIDTLGVADQVVPRRVDLTPDGTWSVDIEILAKQGALVTIAGSAAGEAARVDEDIRGELRRALRMCPLCQRIGHVEKLRNAQGQQEACVVRCPACGEFEIDQALIRDFRSAWERGDRSVLDRLPAVAEATRRRPGAGARLTRDNWRSIE